jgi:hypothetical protein
MYNWKKWVTLLETDRGKKKKDECMEGEKRETEPEY